MQSIYRDAHLQKYGRNNCVADFVCKNEKLYYLLLKGHLLAMLTKQNAILTFTANGKYILLICLQLLLPSEIFEWL